MFLKSVFLSGVLFTLAACTGAGHEFGATRPSLESHSHAAQSLKPGLELTWYQGKIYYFNIASSSSANPNQIPDSCFKLGPYVQQQVPTQTLYAIFWPGANMHVCNSDSSSTHDHLISAVPGVPGYSPHMKVLIVVTDVNFDPSIMPIKSVDALNAAVAARQLTILPFESTGSLIIQAPVVEGSR